MMTDQLIARIIDAGIEIYRFESEQMNLEDKLVTFYKPIGEPFKISSDELSRYHHLCDLLVEQYDDIGYAVMEFRRSLGEKIPSKRIEIVKDPGNQNFIYKEAGPGEYYLIDTNSDINGTDSGNAFILPTYFLTSKADAYLDKIGFRIGNFLLGAGSAFIVSAIVTQYSTNPDYSDLSNMISLATIGLAAAGSAAFGLYLRRQRDFDASPYFFFGAAFGNIAGEIVSSLRLLPPEYMFWLR